MKRVLMILMVALATFSCKGEKGENVLPPPSSHEQEKPQATEEPEQKKDGVEVDKRCVKSGSAINLATYNVGVFNKSGTNSMEMISKMMKEWDCDAISVNELDSCNTRSGLTVFQLKDFARVMGDWNYKFASAISYKSGKYGIGVVTPHAIKNSWTVSLPRFDDSEIRAVAVVETDKFVFCSCHLGLKENAQLGQIETMNKFMEQNFSGCSKPVFFCGDMNAEPQMATIKKLEEDWTILSTTENTFSTSNRIKCIDYVFLYKKAAQVKGVKTSFVGTSFKNGNPLTASDHFPVFVQVEL